MINEKIYAIDYDKMVRQLTPVHLRFSQMMRWAEALVHQVKAKYEHHFIPYRNETLLRLSVTSSRCRLEYLLNFKFYEAGLKAAYDYRIVLSEGTWKRYLYIFLGDGGADPAGGVDQERQRLEENKALYLDGNHALYTRAEIEEYSTSDYLVKIPTAVYNGMSDDNFNSLKSWLKQYQLPGLKFKIVDYQNIKSN